MIDIKRSANRPRANFSNNFEELLMDKQKVVSLPMSKIEPFSFNGDPQPFAIDENEISALADSISKCGLITPIKDTLLAKSLCTLTLTPLLSKSLMITWLSI